MCDEFNSLVSSRGVPYGTFEVSECEPKETKTGESFGTKCRRLLAYFVNESLPTCENRASDEDKRWLEEYERRQFEYNEFYLPRRPGSGLTLHS